MSLQVKLQVFRCSHGFDFLRSGSSQHSTAGENLDELERGVGGNLLQS